MISIFRPQSSHILQDMSSAKTIKRDTYHLCFIHFNALLFLLLLFIQAKT